MRQLAAWNLQSNWLGASGEKQRAIALPAAIHELDFASSRVNGNRTDAEAQLDALLAVKFRRAQRDPFLGCVPGEIIFRQIRTIAGRGRIVAQYRDRTGIALVPQRLRGCFSCCAAADDDDRLRGWPSGSPRLAARRRKLFADIDGAVLLLDAPARHRVESRRAQRLAGAQAETGVMPGPAHGIRDHPPFGERAVVVAAFGADREQL